MTRVDIPSNRYLAPSCQRSSGDSSANGTGKPEISERTERENLKIDEHPSFLVGSRIYIYIEEIYTNVRTYVYRCYHCHVGISE